MPTPEPSSSSSPRKGGARIVAGHAVAGQDEVLSAEALGFVADLVRAFGDRVGSLLERRREVARLLDAGKSFDFLEETSPVRAGDWTVAPVPRDLLDRRVEITGPVDRKMIINALNSGASVFMADFEDSNAPGTGLPSTDRCFS